MIEETRKREYCKECGSTRYYGDYRVVCDYCQKDITNKDYNKDHCEMLMYIENPEKSNRFQFCDWTCLLNYMSKAQLTYFDWISLPFLKKKDVEILQERLDK